MIYPNNKREIKTRKGSLTSGGGEDDIEEERDLPGRGHLALLSPVWSGQVRSGQPLSRLQGKSDFHLTFHHRLHDQLNF